jgi:hypothetical protein
MYECKKYLKKYLNRYLISKRILRVSTIAKLESVKLSSFAYQLLLLDFVLLLDFG